jgi:hypothetical protein
MFTPKQYRAKAVEYGEMVKTSTAPNEKREFQKLEDSFSTLADNEQWLVKNQNKTVHASEREPVGSTVAARPQGPDQDKPAHAADGASDGAALAADEDHILRCLGGALIMQWNTLPAKLQKELFDNAGAMGELLQTEELRGQIARFLHKHKN